MQPGEPAGVPSPTDPAAEDGDVVADETYQVVIVGGGPVGVGLAIDLGLRGIRVALVERRTQLSGIPKGQNLTQRTMEHFWFWGVADQIRSARAMPQGYPIGGVTAYGDLMSDYWYAPPGREIVSPYYFQRNERLPQYRTEEVLRKRLAELDGVTTFFGWTATAVDQDDDGVSVLVEAGDERRRLNAQYVVGCDGGRSLVRAQSDIERGGTDFDKVVVLLVFRSTELHDRLERFPHRSTYRVMHPDLEGYWAFFGRVDVGSGWFFHAPVEQGAEATEEDIRALLHRTAGFEFSYEVDHVGFWDLAVEIAEKYRHGRAFIAGDAAHTHPPYGGFGLNNGLEDAANLSWKLAAAIEGWGGETLLDSYSTERSAIFRDICDNFIAAGIDRERRFLERYSPERDRAEFEEAFRALGTERGPRALSYEPHYEGSPVIAGPPDGGISARGTHVRAARPGHHLAPSPLSSGQDVFEALGTGFTLIASDPPPGAVEAFQESAAALGIPLAVVRDDAADVRGTYGCRLVLVRPDQYVVWTGDDLPDDCRSLWHVVAGTD